MGLRKPGGSYFTARQAAVCVGIYWTFTVIFNGPVFAWADIASNRRASRDCALPHVDRKTLNVYMSVKLVFTFFMPMIITWITYGYIIYKTHKTWNTVIFLSSFKSCSLFENALMPLYFTKVSTLFFQKPVRWRRSIKFLENLPHTAIIARIKTYINILM